MRVPSIPCGDIEDLAFSNRSSRESDFGWGRGCVEQASIKGITHRLIQDKMNWLGLIVWSSTAAENSGERMALKIRTGAKGIAGALKVPKGF